MGSNSECGGDRTVCMCFSTLTMAVDDQPCSSRMVNVCLEESDIEGAILDEPLETKTVNQLRWWLTCHG